MGNYWLSKMVFILINNTFHRAKTIASFPIPAVNFEVLSDHIDRHIGDSGQ
jgi:hypothetical protein